MTCHRKGLFALGLSLVCLGTGAEITHADQDVHPTEYDVKAAYLFNFSKFVQWPSTGTAAFCIGVLGEDPFRDGLDHALAGKTVHDQPLVIRHFQNADEAVVCPMVYISPSENAMLPKILTTFKKASVLTVGDTLHFVEKGGVIGFERIHSTIRFDVNLTSARDSHLQISSQLLKVAHAVVGAPETTVIQ